MSPAMADGAPSSASSLEKPVQEQAGVDILTLAVLGLGLTVLALVVPAPP